MSVARHHLLGELEARIDRLRRPDDVRAAMPWWTRMRARWLGTREVFRIAALEHATACVIGRSSWDAHADALVAELEHNVSVAEDRAVAGHLVNTDELVWLASLRRWIANVDEVLDRPHTFDRMVRGLGRRPLDARPGSQPPRLRAINALLDEAAVETERLGRRRRLLEAARRAVLETNASHPDTCGILRRVITHELIQARRIETAGVHPEIVLRHQLDLAITRRTPLASTLAAAASYLGADLGLSHERAHAVARLAHTLDDAPANVEGALAPGLATLLDKAYETARARLERDLETATPARALALRRRRTFLGPRAHLATMRAMLAADASLEIGGGLSHAQFDSNDAMEEEVPFPAARLHLVQARSPEDLRDAVFDDPRRVLHQLASGDLLVRRYLRPRRANEARAGNSLEVRLFLLDGSSSMLGARARMRDAVMLTELTTLIEQLSRGGRVRQLLYYRFFHTESEPTRRVRTAEEALRAIDDIIGVERSGGTNIQGAIVDALREIEWARAHDIALTRAQIVLVSDGEADVDADAIVDLRARLGVPTRIAIVALGREGPGLRALADAQGHAGARVFYHHLSDEELEAWERGDDTVSPTYRLNPDTALPWDEIALLWPPDAGVPVDPGPLEEALAEVGLSQSALDHTTAARLESMRRDVRALEARFERWFPELTPGPATLAGPDDERDLASIEDALKVLETLDTPGVSHLERMADAIAVFVRVLYGLGITPERYAALIARHSARIAPHLGELRRHYRRAQAAASRLA